jgi:hypothetical protein
MGDDDRDPAHRQTLQSEKKRTHKQWSAADGKERPEKRQQQTEKKKKMDQASGL